MKKYISPLYEIEVIETVDAICASGGLVSFEEGVAYDKEGNVIGPSIIANVSFDSLMGNN